VAFAVVIALIGLGARDKALADDGTIQFKGSETVEHDDNPLLLTSGAKSVNGSITEPEATINEDTPLIHLDLDTKLDFNEYDLPHFSSTDTHVAYHSNYKGQTLQFGLDGNVDYDTTRTSELTASGLNIAGIRHLGVTYTPHAEVFITPVDQAVFNGSYNNTTYADTKLYTDYRFISANPALQHALDPLDTVSAGIQSTEFGTTVGPAVTIYSIGPLFGWTRNFSQRLSATATLGAIGSYGATSISNPPGSSPMSYDYTYSLDLAFTGQQDTIHLTASRSPSPEGNGTEALQSSYGLTERHAVTTRTDLDLSAQYISSSYTQKIIGAQASYISLSPKVNYHLTQEWEFSSEFRYRHQDSTGIGQSASSNAILFHLIYTPTTLSLGW